MKPLITTADGLKELATGVTLSAAQTATGVFLLEGANADFLLTQKDDETAQRVIIIRERIEDDPILPEILKSHRRAVLSRMASFAERAQAAGSLALPHAWHQYKHNNLITFFAVPAFDSRSVRWITEILSGTRSDVIFWEADESKVTLQQFDQDKQPNPLNESEWSEAFSAAQRHFAGLMIEQPSDVEIALTGLEHAATRGRSYDDWMNSISDDQKAFVTAPSSKSIRLRGPAGSGKTLALILKAVHDLLEARKSSDDIRVLVVTQSWSLATEISDSKDALSLGPLPEVDVFPLLEIASAISPGRNSSDNYKLIGNDSFSGKLAQLEEISGLLAAFVASDWVTFKTGVSPILSERFDSKDPEEAKALAWDLIVEFGSVIGAAAIFPGAGAENRYASLDRASWMLPLNTREDLRVVFELYVRYMESLDARGLLTSDQVLADLLNDLQKHSWNRARKTEGYDLIFVDEFHLFNPLERQVLHYLSRDVGNYPRIFMALDPRQSPSEAFIGLAADETRSSAESDSADDFGEVTNFELTKVHRYTPEILGLVKHIHHEFPTLDLGSEWNIDLSNVESARGTGTIPSVLMAATRAGEETDIARAVQDLYQNGRMALAIIDTRQWSRFSALASSLGKSSRYHVSTIAGRTDVEGLGYRKRGLVVGPAEYLAGLQFDTVLVAGIPDLGPTSRAASDLTRLLSLLYLGISRAENSVRIFVNEDDGGVPDVLQRAVSNNLVQSERGSLT